MLDRSSSAIWVTAVVILSACTAGTQASGGLRSDAAITNQHAQSLSFPFQFPQVVEGSVYHELNLTAVMRESEPAESSCDVIGTWVAYAHRINGGKMSLVGESILVFNGTHWARIQAIGDDVFGSAGTYGVVGDSLSWHGGIGARDLDYSEACWIDADGLHMANKLDPNALRETDYRRVK